MKVYFKKPWKEYKVGEYDLWDATQAIASGCAVPYEFNHLNNEPQAETKTAPQSEGTNTNPKSKAGKNKRNK